MFSHKYNLAGGIALFYFSSPGQVLIDSCSIINNTIGLVLIDLAADYLSIRVTVNINNTQYSNHPESSVLAVKNYDSQSSLQLLNVNETGQLVIYSDSNERYSYKELGNGYVLSVSFLNLTVQSSDNIRNSLPFFSI